MTTLFLACTSTTAVLAVALREELRQKGYTLPDYPSDTSISFTSQVERAIIGSAAVIILWESSAAISDWETLHIGTARRFQKPLFPILLDGTPLPASLATLSTLSGQLLPAPTISVLSTLSGFPSARGNDPLDLLHEEATNHLIRIRRAAIEKAAAMLTQDQYRDAVLRLLVYLSEHDQTDMLRKEAGKVLQEYIPREPFTGPQTALMIGGHCEKGHLSYYNKRDICLRYRDRALGVETQKRQQDELIVPCKAKGCSLPVTVHVDCGAYL